MKTKILALAVIIVTVISCSNINDDASNKSLQGTWKLTEVLLDPGNGSGTFKPVNSSKMLTLSNDGKLSSNGEICNNSIETGISSTATYSETKSTINCSNFTIKYELIENSLILSYPGRESDKAKYILVEF